ncbi:MAG: DUF2164 domain-containing protein [Christensenellales bacterium]|jgi:uncharacterized protein (DUF2164 family)
MARRNESIELPKAQKAEAAGYLKRYLQENFELEIGGLEAEVFLRGVTENIGLYYYNKGIRDAYSLVSERVEDLFALTKLEP